MKGKPNESLQMINDEFGVSGNFVTREKVEKYWKLMEPNELLSGMFISGVTADVAFYGDCARQQMPRRLKDRAISFNAKKR